jgi:hypothetical protein
MPLQLHVCVCIVHAKLPLFNHLLLLLQLLLQLLPVLCVLCTTSATRVRGIADCLFTDTLLMYSTIALLCTLSRVHQMTLLLPLLTANAALRTLDEATLLPLTQCAEYRVLDRLQASHSV